MPSQRMGDMFRSRREELGYSIDEASRATNIRSRVLQIFEGSDYENFPPAGYAQGMVSSYARFLKLDPHQLLNAYESEYSVFSERSEIASAATRARKGLGRFGEHRDASVQPKSRKVSSGRDKQPLPDSALAQEHVARHDDRYKSGSVKVVNSRPGVTGSTGSYRRYAEHPRAAAVRGNTVARPASASGLRDAESARAPSHGKSEPGERMRRRRLAHDKESYISRTPEVSSVRKDDESLGSGYNLRKDQESQQRAARKRRRAREEEAPRGVLGKARAAVVSVFQETRTRLIAAAVILIVIALAVAANILISTAGNDQSGVLPVEGGAEDTTKADMNSKNASATITTTNGNPVSVHIEVAEGSTSVVNVTFDDDNAYNGTAVGPWERNFQVTESMSATFGNPDAVKVTENGNDVQIDKNDDGSGSVTLEIVSASTAESDDQSKGDK